MKYIILLLMLIPCLCKGADNMTKKSFPIAKMGKKYVLKNVIEVAGRQGVACDGTYYYISSSTALYKYDMNGKLITSNEKPFTQLKLAANHFGDIDVYNGDIYTGIETFIDGVGKNIQIAVYDAKTLAYKYSIPWNEQSGQVEVCGLAIDKKHKRVWMADWVQGKELYCYDLTSHNYVGKVALDPAPRLQQGILIKKGKVIISCDDGDAEQNASDHLYYADLYVNDSTLAKTAKVKLWRTMTDFKRVGEIEGLTLNPKNNNLIVLTNRGARIILGMPKGFYEGYDHEIHEIYIYELPKENGAPK